MASETPPAVEYDFFISYTGKDQAWAEWIAWQLEDTGHRTLIQAWDFKSGGVFPGDMHRALQHSTRVIAILTPAYMESGFCQPEWQAAFANDPTGEKGLLVCVRVVDFQPDGLLRGRTYIDLVGKDAATATAFFLERLKTGRAKPATAPQHPPSAPAPANAAPAFPGRVSVLSTSIPHNLPTLQPFFGREDELRKIADALDPDSRTWGALIDGPGGMGKTYLAVRAAYDVSPVVFKKIIYISLKTRELDDDGVRDLSGFILSGLVELLNDLARELARDDIPKAPKDQRPRLLLDALRGTQTLLVLDNLESLIKPERDTLFTFVKKLPAGCKAILTSRRRIGSCAEELILEKLSEQAALDTLAELATHNPHLAKTNEAERLVLCRETAGTPLLLRWTAGQIGRGHCLTFTDALHFLRSCPKGNDPLEFIFGDLVEDFDEAETAALCALTYFTLPAKVEHIAAIAGRPELDIDRVLRSLVNRSLVVPTDEFQTFTLVPLVADFLRKKKPEVVAETGNRLEKRAYALIMENGYQKHDRFPMLDAAWPTVAAALPLFLIGPNELLQRVCAALSRYLRSSGRWDECLHLCEWAECRAKEDNNFKEAGWRAYQAGFIYFERNLMTDFRTWAMRAHDHWNQPGIEEREKAAAIRLNGLVAQSFGDYKSAKEHFTDALQRDRALNPISRDVSKDLYRLSLMEERLGNATAAKSLRTESHKVESKLDEVQGAAFEAGENASAELKAWHYPQAQLLAEKALTLARDARRLDLEASNSYRLAKALVRQRKAAEALEHAIRAVDIYIKLNLPDLDNALATLIECRVALEEDQPCIEESEASLRGAGI